MLFKTVKVKYAVELIIPLSMLLHTCTKCTIHWTSTLTADVCTLCAVLAHSAIVTATALPLQSAFVFIIS